MNSPRLFLLATKLEAKPILEDPNESWRADGSLKNLFHSENDHSLLITGIGPTQTALSVGMVSSMHKEHCWTNLGIVGSLNGQLKIGDIGNISLVSSEYESHPFDRSSDSYQIREKGWACMTVGKALHDDQLRKNLSSKADVVDMELYALAMASKMFKSTLESRKIVSDFSSKSDKHLIVKRIPELMASLWQKQKEQH